MGRVTKSCFNAATTRESWKALDPQRGAQERTLASTQPRLVSRGKDLTLFDSSRGEPCFNAATTRESWKERGV